MFVATGMEVAAVTVEVVATTMEFAEVVAM